MPKWLRYQLGVWVAVILGLIGTQYYQAMVRDIHWTPKEMALSPMDAKSQVEVYVGGTRIGDLYDGKEVSLRLNNRAEALNRAHMFTLICLMSALGVLLVFWLRKRPPNE